MNMIYSATKVGHIDICNTIKSVFQEIYYIGMHQNFEEIKLAYIFNRKYHELEGLTLNIEI